MGGSQLRDLNSAATSVLNQSKTQSMAQRLIQVINSSQDVPDDAARERAFLRFGKNSKERKRRMKRKKRKKERKEDSNTDKMMVTEERASEERASRAKKACLPPSLTQRGASVAAGRG